MGDDANPPQPASRERREVLLVEYQKAQDSAEHHDGLVFNTTSLNWVGSAVLMGFVLNGIDAHPTTSHKVALLSIAAVGFLLSYFVWRWVRQLRKTKVAKYNRCKEIEKELGMTQHSSLQYRAGSQTHDYEVLMSAFLTAWVVVAVVVIIA
jgi:hypothetical protein